MAMMFSYLISVLIGFLFFSPTVDAKTGEFLQMKIFNENFGVSDSEMHEMIKEANLTGHGYKKEVTIRQKQDADTGKLEHEKRYFFYKEVNCSQIGEIDQELDNLLPGVLGKDAEIKFRSEVKFRHLENMGTCRVGLEVHFNESQGCDADQTVSRRRKKRFSCWFCKGCKVVQKK